MYVRFGLRFYLNKVFYFFFFVLEGSIVFFFEIILKFERIVLRLRYYIFEMFLCIFVILDVLELVCLGGKVIISYNKYL